MITVKEVTHFFRSYEVKCDEKVVAEWMEKNPVGRKLRDDKEAIDEWDMYNFSDWWRVYGTAQEEGIDDKTKITRLLEEIADLKKANEELRMENLELISKLDILPF